MNKIAQFHKVSFEQFKESWDDSFPGDFRRRNQRNL